MSYKPVLCPKCKGKGGKECSVCKGHKVIGAVRIGKTDKSGG